MASPGRWTCALALAATVSLAAAGPAAAVETQTATAPGGQRITVDYSDALEANARPPAQAYADFLGGLVHGSELDGTHIYLGTPDEVTTLCAGDIAAQGCYGERGIIVPSRRKRSGEQDPTFRATLLHEYGHEIADKRETVDDGDALPLEWGPRRWSSYEHVCQGVAAGTLFPGNEGEHYYENPGESWAETYVRLNDPAHAWGRNALEPDAGALEAARRDVVEPFRENTLTRRKLTFGRRGTPTKTVSLLLALDGTVEARSTAARGLEVDLVLSVDGRKVDRSPYKGRTDRASGSACRAGDQGTVTVTVKRRKGAGKVALTVSRPVG